MNVSVEEMVVMFLSIISHDENNRPVKFNFIRFGKTVSKFFNAFLLAMLRLCRLLPKAPEPITEECTDHKWKWFKVFNVYPIFICCLRLRFGFEYRM